MEVKKTAIEGLLIIEPKVFPANVNFRITA